MVFPFLSLIGLLGGASAGVAGAGVTGNAVGALHGKLEAIFRDPVDAPVPGSVLYCDLVVGQAEHTGIYVGNNQIVHLNGDGLVELVGPGTFINRLDGLSTGSNIFVSCVDGKPVGSAAVAAHARSLAGQTRKYSLLERNCHQLTCDCLYQTKMCPDNLFVDVKTALRRTLGANDWRVWKQFRGIWIDFAGYPAAERIQVIEQYMQEISENKRKFIPGDSDFDKRMRAQPLPAEERLLEELAKAKQELEEAQASAWMPSGKKTAKPKSGRKPRNASAKAGGAK